MDDQRVAGSAMASATAAAPPLIEFAGVEKTYRTGSVELQALRGADLEIDAGEMVSSECRDRVDGSICGQPKGVSRFKSQTKPRD